MLVVMLGIPINIINLSKVLVTCMSESINDSLNLGIMYSINLIVVLYANKLSNNYKYANSRLLSSG